MPKIKSTQEKIEELDQIRALLEDKRFKDTHFNFQETPKWLVSTGSIMLDYALSIDGRAGIGSQILKIAGDEGTGKTSFCLSLAKNFQDLGDNFFAYYCNAEGRLNDELIKRSAINTDKNKWFVLHSNTGETVFGMIRELIQDNPLNRRYCFIIDSLDAIVRLEDLSKDFTDCHKVAGVPLLSKTFCKTTSLPITKGNHLLLITGQNISNIGGSTNAPKTVVSGGKAVKFFSTTILEVKPVWTETIIWENPSGSSIKEKGKRLGHYFQVEIKKAIAEKAGEVILVPIKHNAPPGQALWKEVEIQDLMISWDLLKKGTGAWYELAESLIKELKDNKIEVEKVKFQGERVVLEYLESNKKLVDYMVERFKKTLFNNNP